CRLSSSLNHRLFTQHVFDLMHFTANEQDVRQVEMLHVSAGRVNDQVSGTQTEDPVAEQVASLFLDGHACGVEGLFSAADFQSHLELARRKNHVQLLIEEHESDQPNN